MPKEAEDEVRASPDACEATIHLNAQGVGRCRGSIPQVLFDIAMAALLGIQIRHIRWEPFHCKVRMRSHIVLDDGRSMRV